MVPQRIDPSLAPSAEMELAETGLLDRPVGAER
jgi:hypothetical protein